MIILEIELGNFLLWTNDFSIELFNIPLYDFYTEICWIYTGYPILINVAETM